MEAATIPTQPLQPHPFAVGQNAGRVLVHFDKPMTWLDVSPNDALSFALDLVESARAAGAVAPDQRRPLHVSRQPKKPRGFLSLSPERRKEIASMGGRAAHESGRAHQFTSDEARAAGRKSAAARKFSTTPTNGEA